MKRVLFLLPLVMLLFCACTKQPDTEILLKTYIHYPKISGYPRFNNAIEEKVDAIIANYRPNEHEDSVTYVSVRKDGVFSIAFFGEVMASGAAHPAKVYECGSFNMKTGEVIPLSSLTEIDDKFLADFTRLANEQLAKLEKPVKLNKIYTKEELKKELEKSDKAEKYYVNTTCSYSTGDGLAIRLWVPHVYGDYIEVRMPETEI